MEWQYVGATLIFAFIGYLIGSVSNAVIVSKFIKKEDVRKKGSGNAGATNTLRHYGKGLAAIVFFLDIMKVVVAILIAWSVKKYSNVEWLSGILIQSAGLAAIIGHIWPLYFKFKGGKGAASTVGFILSMQWILVIVGIILFITIVIKTKKVSLGSMLGIFVIVLFQIAFSFIPGMTDSWSIPIMNDVPWWVNTIFMTVIWLLVMFSHRDNIKRLIKGKERTLKV